MRAFRTLAITCTFSAILAGAALAQNLTPGEAAGEYKPTSGQAGKDVVWVPTPQALVDRMLDMAKLTKNDFLIDLGSGDGRTVITAARRGARAHGIEYNPELVTLSERNAQAAGVAGRATFERADIFQSDFSKADVITLFLLPDLNLKLRPILLKMKPGTRVVSNTFAMGDWKPDQQIEAPQNCISWCRAYKWIIPADVSGAWRLGESKLQLTQTYQTLAGTLTRGGKVTPIRDAKMNGAAISFTAGDRRYIGRVTDDKMIGSSGGKQTWSATRVTGA